MDTTVSNRGMYTRGFAKKLAAVLLLMAIALGGLIPARQAQAATKVNKSGKVLTNVNLRKKKDPDSKKVATLSKGVKVTVLKKSDGWYQIKTSGGKKGYVRTGNIKLTSSKSGSSSSKSSKVIMGDWDKSSHRNLLSKGSTAKVIDVKSGKSFKIRYVCGSSHMDVEPKAASDTKKMKKIYGGSWSWDRRPIWLVVDGKKYAASMNGKPHGSTQISTSNKFKGVFCIHFLHSETHGSDKVDPDHQACVKAAYKAGN